MDAGAATLGAALRGAWSSFAHTPLRWFIVGTWESQHPIEQNTSDNLAVLHVETLHV